MTSKTVIFGGSSGIGEAVAKVRLAAGDAVVIVGRNPEGLQNALGRLASPSARSAQVDASDPLAVARFFSQDADFDHLVLAHSGGKGAGPFQTLSMDDLRSGLEGKLLSQLTVCQAALGVVQRSITFVTAVSARMAMPGTSGLAAINGAIERAIPVLAKELAPLRINAVSPGVIDTPWWNGMAVEAKDAFFEQARQNLPVRRVGSPQDVAVAISMLMDNSFMTGTIVEVDGGAHLG